MVNNAAPYGGIVADYLKICLTFKMVCAIIQKARSAELSVAQATRSMPKEFDSIVSTASVCHRVKFKAMRISILPASGVLPV